MSLVRQHTQLFRSTFLLPRMAALQNATRWACAISGFGGSGFGGSGGADAIRGARASLKEKEERAAEYL